MNFFVKCKIDRVKNFFAACGTCNVIDFSRKLNDFTVRLNLINYFYNVLMSRNSHKQT